MGFFHAVDLYFSPFAGEDFHHLRGEVALRAFGVVTEEHGTLCPGLGHHEDAAHAHEIGLGCRYIHHLHGRFELRAGGEVDEEAVLGEEGVEEGDAVVSRAEVAVGPGGAVVEAAEEFAVGLGGTAEGFDHNALGEEHA